MKIKTGLLLPVVVLVSGNSQADDLSLIPDIRLSERYEDNVTMQSKGNERATLISTISPSMSLRYREESNDLNANFRWNQLYYHEEPSLDFSEKLANVKYGFTGERVKIDLNTGYLIQSSLNTQLDETGSGNIQRNIPRTTRSASPGFTFFFDELNSLRLGYDYSDVSFERDKELISNQNFSDYDNQQYSANFFHVFNEFITLNFLASYTQFVSSGNSAFSNTTQIAPGFDLLNSQESAFTQKSDMLLYQAGVEYAFDERTKLSLSAGIRNTDTQSVNEIKNISQFTGFDPNISVQNFINQSNSSGHVFSAGFNRNTEWGSFAINAGQQINPATTGSQQSTTTFSAGLRYNLTERLVASLNGNYLLSESVSEFRVVNNSNQFRDNSRTYISFSPSLKWRWTPELNWDLTYTHRSQEFSLQNETVYGNTMQLQFSYQPQINNQVK